MKLALPFSWNRDLFLGLLLIAATFLAYKPAWNGKPIWDDNVNMIRPELRSATGLVHIWTQPGEQQYYPLEQTFFWLEHRLFGDATTGYHLLNILLHVFSALLLVTILRRLSIPGEAAWLAGGIFALHPVMVESVAWITEQKNTLSGVFFLSAGLAYLKFDNKQGMKHYSVALLLFLFGLLAKSAIVTLPASLLVVFWWKRGRIGWKRDVAPLLPFFAIGIVSGVFTVWVERRFVGAVGSEFNLVFIDRCLIAGRAVWFYLYKLVWPANLIFIYPRWHINAAAVWQYLFPAALLIIVVLFWGLRHRSRAPLAVVLYFTVTLSPTLGFFTLYFFHYSFVADHFQYIACIGPIAAVAAGIVQGTGLLKERLRRPLRPLVCAMLLLVLFLLSWKKNDMYVDAETLYRTTIRKNPDCWMAHNNLGFLLTTMGRTEDAMAHFLKTLELDPNHAGAHNNLGFLLASMGRTEDAMAQYQKALELNPHDANAHNNLGFLLASMGRTEDAMAHLQKALELDPNHAGANNNLGHLLSDMGRPDEALTYYLKAVELIPNYGDAHYNLGVLLSDMGRPDEALTHYLKAVELNPNNAEAHNNLGVLLSDMGRTDEAMAHLLKAVELNPNYAKAHNNLGILLEQSGRTDNAIAHYRKALEINPEALGALKNLAFALGKKGGWTDAASVLKKALASAKSAGDEAQAKTIKQFITQLHEVVNSSEATLKTHTQ